MAEYRDFQPSTHVELPHAPRELKSMAAAIEFLPVVVELPHAPRELQKKRAVLAL